MYYKKSIKILKRGNQNPYIEEEQTTQWPREKVQTNKQRSTKHTYKAKDRVTRTPLKTGCELVTNPVISHERGKDREGLTTSGLYPCSIVTHIFYYGQPSRCGDCKLCVVFT
jgi:hypothetical protein